MNNLGLDQHVDYELSECKDVEQGIHLIAWVFQNIHLRQYLDTLKHGLLVLTIKELKQLRP